MTTDTSRMISGIGTLNMSTDVESSSHFMIGRADGNPPPAPQLGRRKRLPPLSSNITGNASFLNVTGKTGGVPILNLNRFLNLEYSGGPDSAGHAEGSFGVLPHGTLSWYAFLYYLNTIKAQSLVTKTCSWLKQVHWWAIFVWLV